MKYRVMIVFPISKINLGLRITSKRADGYHDIETVFYPIRLCDALEFIVSDNPLNKDFLNTTGISSGTVPEDNLVYKTIKSLRERYTFPFLKIHLHKAIPVGAGLGGGSSDSACILKAVNKTFRLNISDEELKTIALEQGSDCPFFIDSIPSIGTGRGDILRPIDYVLKDYYLILLNPGISINTRKAYQNCKPAMPSSSLSELIIHPLSEWKELIINDFEDYVCKEHPVIGNIKNDLYNAGAVFSLMSGSGSSVYGIFHKKPDLPEKLKKYLIYEGEM